MSDLLKKSIADAKAVREAALANAKSFLEEQFSSQVSELFADKLSEEIDSIDEENEGMPDETEGKYDFDENEKTDDFDENEKTDDFDDENTDISDEELNEILSELESQESSMDDSDAEALEGLGLVPADNVKNQNLEEEIEEFENEDQDNNEEISEELDLNEILAELEETSYDNMSEDEEDEEEEETGEEEEPIAEDVTIDEMADALISIDEENRQLRTSLQEHIDAIKKLKNVLSETNLLNAKLLYTNKLFKGRSLSESQKLKIIDTFDLTKSIREVKLAYSVLAESFNSGGSVVKNKKTNTTAQRITEGLASKPIKSTTPIVEPQKVDEMALRFQKLAGIIK